MKNLQVHEKIKKKFLFYVLMFFLLLNFATTGGHLYSIDDVRYFLHTENLVLNNSIELNPSSPNAQRLATESSLKNIQKVSFSFQGKEWSINTPLNSFHDWSPLLISLLMVPLYLISVYTTSDPVTILGFFTNSIFLSLSSFMIFLTSFHYFNSKKISLILSLVFLVSTWVWSYNTGMMTRPLAALFVVSGFYFLVTTKNFDISRPFVAGVFFGFSVLTAYSTLVILPGLVIFGIFNLRKNRKSLFVFLLGMAILLIAQTSINQIRYDSFYDFGIGHLQDIETRTTNFEGIIWYVFSLGWGIFFNAPLLVLFPPAVYLILKKDKALGLLLLYCFLATWIFNGTGPSPHWSGYGAWGPRYFTTILPLMIFSLGFLVKRFSYAIKFNFTFIGLAVLGFFVSLMGKLVWYYYGYTYSWNVLKTSTMENWWELANFNIQYIPLTLHILTLQSNYIIETFSGTVSTNVSRGLAPCPYDLFIYCELGISSFVLILFALIVVAFFIIRILIVPTYNNSSPNSQHWNT